VFDGCLFKFVFSIVLLSFLSISNYVIFVTILFVFNDDLGKIDCWVWLYS
jgi:hypothetical protein